MGTRTARRQQDDRTDLPATAQEFLADFGAKLHAFGHWAGNDKHPLAKGGYATATDDLAEINRRADNPAATGLAAYPVDYLVIDIDVSADKDGRAALAELASQHGAKVPQTAFVASPRGNGSGHLYFNIPAGVIIPSSNGKIAPGLDVRGNDGAYWHAAPGSRTAKGSYDWERGPEHIQDAPQWLLEACQNARHGGPRDRGAPKELPPCVTWDDPRNIARFVEWLKTDAKPSISGQNGNDTLAKTAAMGSSFALYEETTIECMREHWNASCVPPWDDDELEYHGGSGYRSAEHVGNTATRDYAPLFREATAERLRLAAIDGKRVDDAARQSRFKIWTVAELTRREPPVWLLNEVIPERGYSILYGPPGSFKTFLALDMALSIATATPWHGRAIQPGRVLYCMGEGSFDAHARINAWLQHHGKALDEDRFKVIEPAPMLRLATDQAEFLGEAERDGTWDLVVIDTVGRVMPGIDDHSGQGARLFTEFTAAMRERLGAATLALTHSPKDNPESLLGSGAYEADADTIYNATIAAKGDRIDLRQHKIKYGAPWEKRIGFRKVSAAGSMTLEDCEASRTVKDKVRSASATYETYFLLAISKAAEADGTARWPNVAATMTGMAGAKNSVEVTKVREQIDNWFRNWPRRAEFDTGQRGAQNAVILKMPSVCNDDASS